MSDDLLRHLQRRVLSSNATDPAAVCALAAAYNRAAVKPGPHECCWHAYELPAVLRTFAHADYCCAPGCKRARIVHPLAEQEQGPLARGAHGDLPPHDLVVVEPVSIPAPDPSPEPDPSPDPSPDLPPDLFAGLVGADEVGVVRTRAHPPGAGVGFCDVLTRSLPDDSSEFLHEIGLSAVYREIERRWGGGSYVLVFLGGERMVHRIAGPSRPIEPRYDADASDEG